MTRKFKIGQRVCLCNEITFPLEMSPHGGAPSPKNITIPSGTIGTIRKIESSIEAEVEFPSTGVGGTFPIGAQILRSEVI